MEKVKNLIYQMLTEDTGQSALDSGGAYERNWQKNARLSREYFEKQAMLEWNTEDLKDSRDIELTVNIYPYLTSILELDEVCDDFNRLECDEWDSEFYGISKKQEQYMTEVLKLEPQGNSFNTYNGDSFLSQVLQGQFFKDGEGNDYVLLQIHGGCDVRGGYTDAKLFNLPFYTYLESLPLIYGYIDEIPVSTGYNRYCLTKENTDEAVKIGKNSKIELYLSE